jgi:hypothetical protein
MKEQIMVDKKPYEKLLKAAKEIKRLYNLKKERTREWGQLANDAKLAVTEAEKRALDYRKRQLDCKVINFQDAIIELCEAIK